MLAFIGTLVSRDVLSPTQFTAITRPLISFGCGAAACVVAPAAAYFTNLCIAGSSTRRSRSYDVPFLQVTPESARAAKRAEIFRWIGVIAVTASIGCFIWGLWSADSAFSALTSASKTQH